MNATDKLQQIASASVRTYLQGEYTMPARKQIVVDYLNTVPLAAAAGFGETNGIGDGLWAWYGLDFDKTNHILNSRFVTRRRSCRSSAPLQTRVEPDDCPA